MDANDFYVGIVTYNPDIETFKKNLSAITGQVGIVVIVDNASANTVEIKQIAIGMGAEVICNARNEGIAKALNQLMEFGKNNSFGWMLSLDQDSICPPDYCEKMREIIKIVPNPGIVAPTIVDKTVGIVGHHPTREFQDVRTCITSGAFVKIDVWEQVGKYDESMFIDSVDFEFCYRVRKHGYQVVQVRDIALSHKLGECEMRWFLLWKVRINNHSAFRKYYIARNNIYYPSKHHMWLHLARGNWRNLCLIVFVLLYEKDKKNKIARILQGWRDGCFAALMGGGAR